MKKNGKRYRRLQKERAERVQQTQEKLSNRDVCKQQKQQKQQKKDKGPVIYKCWHETRNSCQLRSISDTECQCTECKTIFPIEFYNYRCGYDGPVSQETLEASLRPVRYYLVEGKIEYLKTEDDPKYAEEQEEIDIIIEKLYVKDEATGKLVICKETYDEVYNEVCRVIFNCYMPKSITKRIRRIESRARSSRPRSPRKLKDYLES